MTIEQLVRIPREQLGQGSSIAVEVGGDAADLARRMAREMADIIKAKNEAGLPAVMIVPVGPVDQFPILAEILNAEAVDCSGVTFINMDEYLDDDDRFVPRDHPLSFRGFMDRKFYDLLDPARDFPPDSRIFPDPADPGAVQRAIDDRGGVEVTYGGIGINGHIAFNEPPEPDEEIGNEAFAALPTRALSMTRETRTINSVTVGGEISFIPNRAVTVGMKEILGSRRLHFFCNRPWQACVVRKVIHGPVTARCPASFLQTHADAGITMADYVAATPDIRLR